MEDFRWTFLRLCKEEGVDPQESVVSRLQEGGSAQGSRLDLRGQSLSADTCWVLGKAFQEDPACTELLLSDCMLTEEGAGALLSGLLENTTLRVLDLKGNNLRSTGAELLGKLLAQSKTLHRLVLEWNPLGVWDQAFSCLCDGLASNRSLTHLDLRNNQINHQGAAQLALALKRNSTLQVLDLRWNNVGLLGGRCLLGALQHNRHILQLQVAGNNIPSDTLHALELSTRHNSDRQSSLEENRSRTRVLSKEIQSLKEVKGRQYLSLMQTIDRQREELGRSRRSSSTQIVQLQEALNERKSAVNAVTARLQMTEAALALAEQKKQNVVELLSGEKAEREEERERRSRERRKEQEGGAAREGKLLRELQQLTEVNGRLRSEVEMAQRRSKTQQQLVFQLKQELTNSTAELKLRLVQAEERLEAEKQRNKQALEDMDSLRQKEVQQVSRHLEESDRALQERIFRLEGQRLQLEEELSKAKAACVAERAQAEEELGRVRAQVRQEEQALVSSLEEKLRSARCSLQELQLLCSQQKHCISDLQARQGQHSAELQALQRRVTELQQELSVQEQQKVVEVSQVRVELEEQVGRLQAERTAQGGLKEKISALERQIKVLSSHHREALLDKDSEMTSMLEKLRLKEAEIQRMREDEAQRASYLQGAVLTYLQGSPLGNPPHPH